MKKMMMAVLAAAAVAAAAVPVQAEATIEMGVEGYMPSARADRLEKLAAAAEAIEKAAAGDARGGEVLLAGLYAGSVAAEKPAVYFEKTVPAPKHERRVSVKAAVDELEGAAPEAAPAAEAGAPAAADEAPAQIVGTDAAADEGDAKPSFGSDVIAGLVSLAVMALLLLVIL